LSIILRRSAGKNEQGCRGMSEFVIDSGEENSYSVAAPQGAKVSKLFEKLAASN